MKVTRLLTSLLDLQMKTLLPEPSVAPRGLYSSQTHTELKKCTIIKLHNGINGRENLWENTLFFLPFFKHTSNQIFWLRPNVIHKLYPEQS